jgi:hypothetical protein
MVDMLTLFKEVDGFENGVRPQDMHNKSVMCTFCTHKLQDNVDLRRQAQTKALPM